MAWKTFGNDRGDRCDENRQIFVQNEAILAIFRPFEVFDLGFDLGFAFGFALVWLGLAWFRLGLAWFRLGFALVSPSFALVSLGVALVIFVVSWAQHPRRQLGSALISRRSNSSSRMAIAFSSPCLCIRLF